MNDLLLPKNDLVFKMLFGDNRNIDILTDFLQSVLSLPKEEYDEVTITNPSLLQEFKDDKLGVLDVSVKTKSGKLIDIEIQVRNRENFKERIIYYLSKMIAGQLKTGRDYGQIRQSISIVITDFVLIPENKCYHNLYHLYDKNTLSQFTDLLEVNTLELPKLPESEDGSPLWAWLNFLKSQNDKELTMATETISNPLIKKAGTIVRYMSEDETLRWIQTRRELFEMDQMVDRRVARREGLEEGLQQGLQQGQQNLIKLLLARGMNKEELSKLAGLDLDGLS